MGDDHDHVWAYGHAIIERADDRGPTTAPAKLCGCGKVLVADGEIGTGDPDEVTWLQPSVFDWDGKLVSITFTIHVELSRDDFTDPDEAEDDIPTSTGEGGSSEHVPGV